VLAEIGVGVEVRAGGGAHRRELGRVRDRRAGAQRVLGRVRPQRDTAHAGQRHPAVVGRDAHDRPVVSPADELLVAPARLAIARDADGDEDLVGPEHRLERPGEEVVDAHGAGACRGGDLDRRAEGEQRHRQVRRRVSVRYRAADRATVPDLRVADLRRRVRQDRDLGLEDLRVHQVGVPGRGADHDLVAVDRDAGQLGEPGDVDEHRRLGQPDLHHRQQ
jgi:hypothetical protein